MSAPLRSWFLTAAIALGLVLLWLGERLVETGTSRAISSGLGALLVLAACALRLSRRAVKGRPDLKQVETCLLGLHGGVLLALVLYLVQSDTFAKLAGQALSVGWPRLAGALGVLWPAVLVTALLPTVLVELALASMTRAPKLELPRVREAMRSGVGLASALIFAFSVQYVASEFDVLRDLSYFRAARPGDATRNMVRSLDAKLEVHLFFPPANEVANPVRAYFDELAGLSPQLAVTLHDQALEPIVAKELGVSGNGSVVFRKGGRKETVFVGTELEKARTALRSLDADVQKRLLQVAKSRRTVYLTAGHGERTQDALAAGDQRGTIELLHRTLQDQNFEVRALSSAEGLGHEVPPDAAAVFVIGPTQPFSAPEAATLEAFEKRGGRLFLALDPEAGLPFTELTQPLGLTFAPTVLCNDKVFARTSAQFSPADRKNIGTRAYSSHPAVTYLGKSQAPLLLMGAGALDEAPKHPPELQIDFAVKSDANTWNDLNANFEAETPPEVRKAYGLLAAVTRKASSGKADEELRALVLSDSDAIADQLLPQVQGNQYLVVDGLKWLLGEEQLQGATNTEQDVPLARSQSQDQAWFYGTLFLAPAAVLAVGFVTRRRPKRAGAQQKEAKP